jgi:hypothetical protein
MNCPGCSAEMTHLALEGRLGTPLEIDLCPACRAIWFDQYEDLRMSAAATLNVFGIISEQPATAAAPLTGVLRCPRCEGRLLLTHDLQRTTPFQYWRCDAGHGRLMAYIDFLREKDFVRPLTPSQLEELKQNIRTINCSNCGAAIDLARDSVCAHCGSAISMLDVQQMARTIAQLQTAAAAHATGAAPAANSQNTPAGGIEGSPGHSANPGAPANIVTLMAALKAEERALSAPNLIETGLGLLGALLRKQL